MKKSILIISLVVLLVLTSCGKQSPAVEVETEVVTEVVTEAETETETVQIPNPWRDITEAEAKTLCLGNLTVPDGAENARWSAMEVGSEPALVQLDFDLDGMSFSAREQMTGDEAADISGMYYEWDSQIEIAMHSRDGGEMKGMYFRSVGEEGYADLCLWYDAQIGITYSLGVTADDLDGFDLRAAAAAVCGAEEMSVAEKTSYEEAYSSVILAYKTAYETGNRTLDYAYENDLSDYIVYGEHVGYALWDIDDDGTQELIIADPYASEDWPVFAIYTLSDGEPVKLAVSYARVRYYLRADGMVCNEGSSGASNSSVILLSKTGTELTYVEGIITFPDEDNEGMRYYLQSGDYSYYPRPSDQEIDSEEFLAIWDEYMGVPAHLDLTPIV